MHKINTAKAIKDELREDGFTEQEINKLVKKFVFVNNYRESEIRKLRKKFGNNHDFDMKDRIRFNRLQSIYDGIMKYDIIDAIRHPGKKQ